MLKLDKILHICTNNNEQFMIGRHQEQERLLSYYNSNKSEFIAVYGRRRIGKTYLVEEVMGNKFCFKITGMVERLAKRI